MRYRNGGVKLKIDIIKVPLFYGCDRPGVEEGPQALMDNGLMDLLSEPGNLVVDKGFVKVPAQSEQDKYCSHPHMKYLDSVIATNEDLARMVAASLEAGNLPFTVGGDHALGLGTLAGTSKVNGPDIGIIWIDAHADINTPESSPSGNIHGMPLSASMGEGPDSLKNIFFKGQKVNPRNCFIIGARSIDEGEIEMIDRLGINVWYMEEIREKGMGIIILEVLELLKARHIKDLHLSYDIDSLDAKLVPGTGTPAVDGMEYDESEKLIKALIKTQIVRSIDFVEFNPKRDQANQITLKSCLRMLHAFADALSHIQNRPTQEFTA